MENTSNMRQRLDRARRLSHATSTVLGLIPSAQTGSHMISSIRVESAIQANSPKSASSISLLDSSTLDALQQSLNRPLLETQNARSGRCTHNSCTGLPVGWSLGILASYRARRNRATNSPSITSFSDFIVVGGGDAGFTNRSMETNSTVLEDGTSPTEVSAHQPPGQRKADLNRLDTVEYLLAWKATNSDTVQRISRLNVH
jgi:hypothetical protein